LLGSGWLLAGAAGRLWQRLRRRPVVLPGLAEMPEVVFAVAWCAGSWLAYAVNSNNYSGECCSVRWFVPLLAPAYYVLAVLLREQPGVRKDFLLLSGWGAVLGGVMWWSGPWVRHVVFGFWPIQTAALLSWLLCRAWLWRPRRPALGDTLAGHPAGRAA